ncbi:uncharacterized protein LOC133196141 [Saccostrea echinata]|uniref:uncharacterized protein LOC133196141 n=1 Tax=Saccostrea echinata TaxID=191078 RepID=UPI002A823C16|nr:uncharacterized protein LOC133196141 [Saccostrea echinata]
MVMTLDILQILVWKKTHSVLYRGVGGRKVRDIISKDMESVFALGPEVVVLMIGENDIIPSRCPDGFQEGDKWPWGDACGVCTCHNDYWTCESCGVPPRAYNSYLESNTHALYPECCPQLVCKGEDNFNQTKIYYPWLINYF